MDIPPFEEWLAARRRGTIDPVWRMTAYQLGRYGLQLGWDDARRLHRSTLTRPIAGQMYRVLGSVPANLAEGYSRSSGRDRVRLFEYTLGSAREAIVWYDAAAPVLGPELCDERSEHQERIIKLMLTAIPAERSRVIRKED